MSVDQVYKSLVDIVGEEYASNRQEELFIYSVDSGTEGPRNIDYVAVPKTTEQVQQIVRWANEYKIPITPMGANLTLNGLGLPADGGIVLDMKRMDRIIKVDKMARYVTIEAGVTAGKLESYLHKHYPDLEFSRQESPPTATIVGNIVIRGHGHISLKVGNNAHLINGMEVVLPTGDVCSIGASSVAPSPFSKGPLPDLAGLFCGWNGTTGIITQLSLKLFPKRKMLDVVAFITQDVDIIPELLYQITYTDMVDNLFVQGMVALAGDHLPQMVTVSITGDTEEDMTYKREVFRRVGEKFDAERVMYMDTVPYELKERFVEKPEYVSPSVQGADMMKGGGQRYCGAIIPCEKIPEAWNKGVEIAHAHGMNFLTGVQILGYCHSANFCFVYPFNRAEDEWVERVTKAMTATNEAVLEMGGIPWKSEISGQNLIVDRMDPNTFTIMKNIWSILDPNGIMNPGNWRKGHDLG